MARKPKLGSGKRFAAIEEKARASVGIKKYGVKKMTKLAQAAKKRKKKAGK